MTAGWPTVDDVRGPLMPEEAPASPHVVANPWHVLRRHTGARIALGRAGISLPTAPHLQFQLAHAQARDAVHHAFDLDATAAAVAALGLSTLPLRSAAADRHIYLQRPDLGRRLDQTSRDTLQSRRDPAAPRHDLALVIADGLSSLAVESHAAPFIAELIALLQDDAPSWRIAPVALVREGRVAVGDDVGELLDANLALVLIGERPGLSSPDSMGLYMTWAPRTGRHDGERNCISNVRPAGLPIPVAAARAAALMRAARSRQLSGVSLKDETAHAALSESGGSAGFLLGMGGSASSAS